MTIARRRFLKAGLAAAGLGVASPLLSLDAAASRLDDSGTGGANGTIRPPRPRTASLLTGDRILVVVNLYGGNDGLNTVIPCTGAAYTRYRQLRPHLRYDQDELLPLAGEPDFSLAPGMTALQGLFGQGKVAILNGVSVPESASDLFSHEAGQYEFQSCDVARSVTNGPPTGWVGRFLDTVEPGPVTPGIDFGGGRLLLTGSSHQPVSINSIRRFRLQVSGFDRTNRRAAYTSLMNAPAAAEGVAETSRLYRLQAVQQSDLIQSATAGYVPSVTYPDTDLGFHLSECAKIIYGNVGTRALAVGAGGFDTHSDQNSRTSDPAGYHASLLRDVSDSIGAFYADLVNLGASDRVLILTISEFGRRAYENGDKGTDHGFSSVAFAVGDAVHGGIYGEYPSLDDLVLDGNLAQTTDFRSVYASALGGFLSVDPVPILGGAYPTIGFV